MGEGIQVAGLCPGPSPFPEPCPDAALSLVVNGCTPEVAAFPLGPCPLHPPPALTSQCWKDTATALLTTLCLLGGELGARTPGFPPALDGRGEHWQPATSVLL